MNSDYNSRARLKPKVPLSKTHKNECDPDNPKIPLHAGAEPRQFSYTRDLRKQMTAAEKILWDCLRSRRFMNLKFRRQHPLYKFIADFYCHELKLVIEVDGKYHDAPETIVYDLERTKELQSMGYQVVRFSNEEVLHDLEGVLERLRSITTSH